MRILITGHDGYIGSVLTSAAKAAGHDVEGLDTLLFADCRFGMEPDVPASIRRDIRDVSVSDLTGFDAIVHLAAISNDPVGNLDPGWTYEINHLASTRLARLAKRAGVPRFVFSSSCSLYGAAGTDGLLSEGAGFNPITPYGVSKVLVEEDVAALADDSFSPTFLRNATVYGISPKLRLDLVANDLVAHAHTIGEILVKSDGTPWRPLVHVEDVAQAFLAAVEAPREAVHNQAFNIGRTSENYRVRDIADIVEELTPGGHVNYAKGGGPDERSYRVDFSKAEESLPGFRPTWTLAAGVRELLDAFRKVGLAEADVEGTRFVRLRRIQELLGSGALGPGLRWSTGERRQVASLPR